MFAKLFLDKFKQSKLGYKHIMISYAGGDRLFHQPGLLLNELLEILRMVSLANLSICLLLVSGLIPDIISSTRSVLPSL